MSTTSQKPMVARRSAEHERRETTRTTSANLWPAFARGPAVPPPIG